MGTTIRDSQSIYGMYNILSLTLEQGHCSIVVFNLDELVLHTHTGQNTDLCPVVFADSPLLEENLVIVN